MADERGQATNRRDGDDEPAGRDRGGSATPSFEDGRYLFCVVRVDCGEADRSPSFSAEGIDGREVGLIVADGLAAVAQPCESLYDASDPATVRRWLLRHQSVVDAAGEAFGTPLPFRFDTAMDGGDERVSEWLQSNAEAINDALDDLAGTWEYRIDVAVEEEAQTDSLEAEDERLASLAAAIEDADEGRAFLHEKQYDERLRELRRERREARAENLVGRIEPHAERVEWGEAGSASASRIGDAGGGAADRSADDVDSSTPSTSLAVQATPAAAEAIGEELEDVAGEPGVEIRYTGPWPPYTFAPTVEDGTGGSDRGP